MKVHGQVGERGGHALPVVVRAPNLAYVPTVVEHRALGAQQKQKAVKVRYVMLFHFHIWVLFSPQISMLENQLLHMILLVSAEDLPSILRSGVWYNACTSGPWLVQCIEFKINVRPWGPSINDVSTKNKG